MQKIASYYRVSSDIQTERGTIQNQIEFAKKYADLHKFPIVAEYTDDGITGTLPLEKRPAGFRLFDDAKNKKFDTLLVYKLDRLGRSLSVVINAVHELSALGVTVRSMTEPFDTETASGMLYVNLLASFADFERSTIIERSALGTDRVARAGKWLGGIVPYGYKLDANRYLEINEDKLINTDMSEASIVRLIFDLMAEKDYSTIRIADYLNALGVPPSFVRDGRKITKGKRKENTAGIWRPSRINNMLKNTTYMGIHQYGKRSKKEREIIERKVEAIVSAETWYKAQATLRSNQVFKDKNAKNNYLLRGLIRCGTCGLTYTGVPFTSWGGKKKLWYTCNGKIKYRGPLQGKCTSKNIPVEMIETAIWNSIIEFAQNPDQLVSRLIEAGSIDEVKAVEYEAEIILVEKALSNKREQRQSVIDLYRNGIIKSSDVEESMTKIDTEKQMLELKLAELEKAINGASEKRTYAMAVNDVLSQMNTRLTGDMSFDEKRNVVRMLVKEIKVKSDGKSAEVNVVWWFSDITGVSSQAIACKGILSDIYLGVVNKS